MSCDCYTVLVWELPVWGMCLTYGPPSLISSSMWYRRKTDTPTFVWSVVAYDRLLPPLNHAKQQQFKARADARSLTLTSTPAAFSSVGLYVNLYISLSLSLFTLIFLVLLFLTQLRSFALFLLLFSVTATVRQTICCCCRLTHCSLHFANSIL